MKKQNLAQRLGQSIRERRLALGYSQDDFADRIDMHRAYYGIIERGVKNVTLPTLHRVAVGLGITMSELLRGIDE
jgi:transcriptional regulator with XRE-family HTH domain